MLDELDMLCVLLHLVSLLVPGGPTPGGGLRATGGPAGDGGGCNVPISELRYGLPASSREARSIQSDDYAPALRAAGMRLLATADFPLWVGGPGYRTWRSQRPATLGSPRSPGISLPESFPRDDDASR